MKKILITGGPTDEPLDEVMKITNMSTGSLSITLAERAAMRRCKLTLVFNESVLRSALFKDSGLAENPAVSVRPISTTLDMKAALEKASKESEPYSCIIHAAAVGDYAPAFSFRMEDMAAELASKSSYIIKKDKTAAECGAGDDADLESTLREAFLTTMLNPDCIVDDSSKISSNEPNLTVKLSLTPKLIAELRDMFPNAILVGFKLLENVPREELIEIARKLCIKNRMDFILANDLAKLREGVSVRHLVNSEGFTGVDLNLPKGPSIADYAAEHWF